MRCFRVIDNEVLEGLTYEQDEDGGFFIRVGDDGLDTKIPLSRTHRDSLAVALSNGLMTMEDQRPLAVADVADSGDMRLIPEQSSSYDARQKALVLVTASAGEGGKLVYTSAGFTEVLGKSIQDMPRYAWDKVHRVYDDFPSDCVVKIAEGMRETGEMVYLLILHSGVGFRMVKTGKVGKDNRVISVHWRGTHREEAYQKDDLKVRCFAHNMASPSCSSTRKAYYSTNRRKSRKRKCSRHLPQSPQ